MNMKIYTVKDFRSLIKEYAMSDLSDFEAGIKCERKARDLAARWTDGRYKTPSDRAFQMEIIIAREIVIG